MERGGEGDRDGCVEEEGKEKSTDGTQWKDGTVIKQSWEKDLDQTGAGTELDQRRNGIQKAEDKGSAGDRG